MLNRTEPDSTSTADRDTAAEISHPRWGYLTRSAGRYGSLTTHLVVYPPDSTATERLWADLARKIIPTAIGGATIGTIVLLGTGVTPEVALTAGTALIAVALLVVAVTTARIRGYLASAWASTSELSPDSAQSRAQDEMTVLSETLRAAARSLSQRQISMDEYTKTWTTVFERTAALSHHRGR